MIRPHNCNLFGVNPLPANMFQFCDIQSLPQSIIFWEKFFKVSIGAFPRSYRFCCALCYLLRVPCGCSGSSSRKTACKPHHAYIVGAICSQTRLRLQGFDFFEIIASLGRWALSNKSLFRFSRVLANNDSCHSSIGSVPEPGLLWSPRRPRISRCVSCLWHDGWRDRSPICQDERVRNQHPQPQQCRQSLRWGDHQWDQSHYTFYQRLFGFAAALGWVVWPWLRDWTITWASLSFAQVNLGEGTEMPGWSQSLTRSAPATSTTIPLTQTPASD